MRFFITSIALSNRFKVLSLPIRQSVISIGGDAETPVTATRNGWPSLPILISKFEATSLTDVIIKT